MQAGLIEHAELTMQREIAMTERWMSLRTARRAGDEPSGDQQQLQLAKPKGQGLEGNPWASFPDHKPLIESADIGLDLKPRSILCACYCLA